MVASDRTRAPSSIAGGGPLGYPPTPWVPHSTGTIAEAVGWAGYLPALGPPWVGRGVVVVVVGTWWVVGVVGGKGCDPKGWPLSLPPMEVQGSPPPWREPSEGEGSDCPAPSGQNVSRGSLLGEDYFPGRSPIFSKGPPLGRVACRGGFMWAKSLRGGA